MGKIKKKRNKEKIRRYEWWNDTRATDHVYKPA